MNFGIIIKFYPILFFIASLTLRSGEVIYSRFLDSPPVKLDPNERILLYTPCRTGSTLVYNVFNYLCEDISVIPKGIEEKRVHKTHYPDKKGILAKLLADGRDVILVVTVRDPIESATSFCNLLNVSYKNGAEHYAKFIARQFVGINTLLARKPQVISAKVLRYEDFNNDLACLLDAIEELVHSSINDEAKEEVVALFSRETMKSISDALGSFEKVDPLTRMHGGHVSKELSEYVGSEVVREAMIPYLTEASRMWGY